MFVLILFPLLIVLLIRYVYKKRRFYSLSKQFKNTKIDFPLIGHAFVFLNEDVEDHNTLDFIQQHCNANPSENDDPIKIWLCTKLIICVRNVQQIEKIILSPKFAHKSEIYTFIKTYLGEGLVTASGETYRQHKKIIVPLLNIDFMNSCQDTFQRCYDECINELMIKCDEGGTFDIKSDFTRCFMRIITRSIMGIDVDYESDKNFLISTEMTYDNGKFRLTRPWLWPNLIYQFTNHAKKEEFILKVLHFYFGKAIQESKKRVDNLKSTQANDRFIPFIDYFTMKIREDPNSMSVRDFRDHVKTLYFAAEDTLTLNSSFCCLCLGMYPEYQKKVAEELRSYFGETPRKVTIEDVRHLPYLDMCIKETLRIIPIAPLVLREVLEECELGEYILPVGSTVMIPVFFLHRNPKYWANPDHFYPDHFLPEIEKKRPKYVYLPFSAGPRGCIGKVFANVNLRIFLATFLQFFEIEADGKIPDIKMTMDISTRPIGGCKVRLKKRVWK